MNLDQQALRAAVAHYEKKRSCGEGREQVMEDAFAIYLAMANSEIFPLVPPELTTADEAIEWLNSQEKRRGR